MESEEDQVITPGDLKKLKGKLKTHLRFNRKRKANSKNKEAIAKARAKKKAESVEVIKAIDNLVHHKVNIVDTDVKEVIEVLYPEAEVKKVIWEPFPGPQTFFLEANEFEVLFSGGRAPGKSDALLIDPLRYCGHRQFRGLMIRKAMPDLRDLIRRAKELYPLAYPGTRWKEQEKTFVFPCGAVIEFGYCDHEDDVGRYQGQEYTWIGIDELTQITSEEIYEKIIASARKGADGLKNYVRATTNPNGPGKGWVKRRFVDLGPENSTITKSTTIINPATGETKEVKTTRKWIHGTVFDNPIYMKSKPEYIAMLQNIDNAVLRKQWLEGDWDSADGLAFDEFDRKTHVIKPFVIPSEWHKFRACDWGYQTKAACLWMSIDFDGNVYVYRELITTKVLAKDFAYKLIDIEREAKEKVRYGILDASAWSMRGENAPSPAEEMTQVGSRENHNLTWRPSDRTGHSRKVGKEQVHKFLQKDPITNLPKLFIFNTCTDLIACLSSIPLDKHDNEDVDTKADDHSYDALRYGLMSRPTVLNNYQFSFQQSEPQTIVNNQFGY